MALLLLQPRLSFAQLNCGSNGTRGALVVPANQTVTLDVPDDGLFHYTTITISGTLLFNRNVAFNPPPILLATGDIVTNVGGSINVSGLSGNAFNWGTAGPGGFDGGAPGIAGGVPGAGHGPGAGIGPADGDPGGNAGYGEDGNNASTSATNGKAYGSALLVPLVGGSGGGGNLSIGGGGGGGAILLCSPTQILHNGVIDAFGGGGTGGSGNGSGGALRMVSPLVRGTGFVRVQGGNGWGGHGRIRIDLIDRSGLQFNIQPTAAMSVGSLMTVFPTVVPRLDVVQVAGNAIAVGTPSPLVYTLPFNSQATQSITVRATGFTGMVPIAVVVTPDAGARIVVNTQINADVAPAETTVNVDLPQNIAVRVHAWTR